MTRQKSRKEREKGVIRRREGKGEQQSEAKEKKNLIKNVEAVQKIN